MTSEIADPKITRGQWMTLAAAFLGWMFDGFEMGLFPLVGMPAMQDLLGPSRPEDVAPWFGLMIAGFLVGAASGGVLFGWLGDRLGRVRAMTLSVLTYAIFMGLCGIASSPTEFFIYRFISSLGMGGEWSLGVALVMEIWPDKSRGLLAGLIGAASNVGFLMIGVIGLWLTSFISSPGLRNALSGIGLSETWVNALLAHSGWRLMMLIGALPALLTFFIRLLVPESERWQEEHRQGTTSHWATRDLLAVLVGACGPLAMIYIWSPGQPWPMGAKIAVTIFGLLIAILGFIFPVLRYVQRANVAGGGTTLGTGATIRRMLLGAMLSGVALLGTWGSVQWGPGWAAKLVEEEALRREMDPKSPTVVKFKSQASALAQILSGIGAIVGTMAALIGNAIGRRPTYILLCLSSFAASLAFFQLNTEFGALFLVTVCLLGATTASFYGWLPLYLPELFPTRVRATGQGFSFNFGRILAAVGALQAGALLTKLGGQATTGTWMSLIYLVGVGLIFLAPETRGKPLPE